MGEENRQKKIYRWICMAQQRKSEISLRIFFAASQQTIISRVNTHAQFRQSSSSAANGGEKKNRWRLSFQFLPFHPSPHWRNQQAELAMFDFAHASPDTCARYARVVVTITKIELRTRVFLYIPRIDLLFKKKTSSREFSLIFIWHTLIIIIIMSPTPRSL